MPAAIDSVVNDYRRHAIDLLRFDAGLRKQALATLTKLEQDLVAKLAASGLGGEGTGMTAFQRQRAAGLLSQVRQSLDQYYGHAETTVQGQLAEFAVIEGRFTVTAMERAFKTEALFGALAPSQLRGAAGDAMLRGAPTTDWWARQKATMYEAFSDQIRQGLVAGETNGDLIKRITGTRANGYKDGVMRIAKRDAASIVHSSVQATANEVRSQLYRENDDVVKGYIYHATLDSHTTQQCSALDGYQWDLDGNPIEGQGNDVSFQQPPIHWNCRSTLLPLLKTFDELVPGVKVDLPPATRASMDGPQVPAKDTFQDWLGGKTDAFQDDLLGPGKAALFRDGKATLLDMIDQSGRPLTLAEIEARI